MQTGLYVFELSNSSTCNENYIWEGASLLLKNEPLPILLSRAPPLNKLTFAIEL